MKQLIPLLMSLFIWGCSSDTSDLQAFITEVQQTTNFPIEPYPEFEERPVFKYGATDTRDPFQRLRNEQYNLEPIAETKCRQPDQNRQPMPLERYGIDALNLQGFIDTGSGRYALIVANDSSVHQVTVGDRLGLFYGRITKIDSDKIHFVEQLPDGTGCWQEKLATLNLAGANGADDNV